MEIKDNTLNIKFDELKPGMCFVSYSQYYMKIKINGFDTFSNSATCEYAGLNLESGFVVKFNSNDKVRLVKGTLIIE